MKQHWTFLMAATTALLMACGDDNGDDNGGGGGSGTDVTFNATMNPYKEYDDNGRELNSSVNRTFLNGEAIGVWAVSSGQQPTGSPATYYYNDGKFSASGGGLTAGGKHIYYAVAPRTSVQDGTMNFSVAANQTTEDQFWASDLCTASSENTSSSSVNLKFFHRLSCVCVNITGSDLTGHSLKVQLNSVKLGAQVTFVGNNCSATGVPTTVQALASGNQLFYAIVPPQSFADEFPLVTVTLDGKNYPVSFHGQIDLLGGFMYYLTITYNGGAPDDPDNPDNPDNPDDPDQPVFVAVTGQINPWTKDY